MGSKFWTVAAIDGRCGVSRRTLKRWKRTGHVPRWAQILIRLLDGELDAIDPAFSGWIIRRGELVSPENWCFTPGEVRSIPLLQTLAALCTARARVSGACETGRPFGAAANDDVCACGDASSRSAP